MAAASINSVDAPVVSNSGGFRPAVLDVRAWTGRSALSSATSTPRPHIATAGERITRVCAARLPASRIDRRRTNNASIAPVASVSEPRIPGRHHALSG
jgi:hypothetical protein